MLKMGWVSYLNGLPFYLPFECNSTNQFTSRYAAPSSLNHMLREGEIDCALTSSIAACSGEYTVLEKYGIAAEKRIKSVNFYLKGDTSSLDGKTIGVTSDTATSLTLLKVFCHHVWRVQPHFESLKPPYHAYEGLLLIGDEALRMQTLPGYQTIDLAACWYEQTGLPFVFALFAANKYITQKAFNAFEENIEKALSWSEAHPETIIEEGIERSKLSASLLQDYFSLCRYRLSSKEWAGFKLFKQMSQDVKEHSPLHTILS